MTKVLVEKAVIEQALEALEKHQSILGLTNNKKDTEAITALREALAEQAEQEPVACKHEWFRTGAMKIGESRCIHCGKWNYAAPVRTKDLTDDEILEITKRFALGIAFPVDGVTTPEMFARAVIAADREKNK